MLPGNETLSFLASCITNQPNSEPSNPAPQRMTSRKYYSLDGRLISRLWIIVRHEFLTPPRWIIAARERQISAGRRNLNRGERTS